MNAANPLIWYAIAIAAVVVATAIAVAAHGGTSHACTTPCIVSFSEPTQEDEYSVDYRHGGTLKVTHHEPA